MPDRDLPPRARAALRALRIMLYALTALAGLAAICWPPTTITSEIGMVVTRTYGTVCLLASLVCLASQVLHRWMWEWIAVWWIGGAIAAYASTIWGLTIANPGRLQQAAVVTALCVTLLVRGVDLAVFAHRQPRRRTREARA